MTAEQRDELLAGAAINPTALDRDEKGSKEEIAEKMNASLETAQGIISNLFHQHKQMDGLPVANLRDEARDGVARGQNLVNSEKHKIYVIWGVIAVVITLFLLIFLYFVFKSY